MFEAVHKDELRHMVYTTEVRERGLGVVPSHGHETVPAAQNPNALTAPAAKNPQCSAQPPAAYLPYPSVQPASAQANRHRHCSLSSSMPSASHRLSYHPPLIHPHPGGLTRYPDARGAPRAA